MTLITEPTGPQGYELQKQLGTYYPHPEERQALTEAAKDLDRYLMWGPTEAEKNRPRPEDYNVKLALVKIGGQTRMIGVDNQTMVGYVMKEHTPEWKLPLEVLAYDEFVRWARLMDV